MDCEQIARFISDGMDRRLPLGKRIGVRMHLMMCRMCRGYTANLQALRKLSAKAGSMFAPSNVSLSDSARDRMRQKLADLDTHS